MFKPIPIERCYQRNFLSLKELSHAHEFEEDHPCLYYAKSTYSGYGDRPGVTVYAFKIVKETACYYTLETGQRVHKNMKGKTFSVNPASAVEKAMNRARRYLNILVTRGREVHGFLTASGKVANHAIHDLVDFEIFAKSVDDVDNIPAERFEERKKRNPLNVLGGYE